MALLEVPEEQILALLGQLSPAARREALRRLIGSADQIERAIDQNRPRIEAAARERGLDWNALTEDQRATLVDEILHE